jgi:thiol-disulfide isomerase/thioredoxin
MARTPSNPVPLGSDLPAATLLDVTSNRPFELRSLVQRPAVVMFICNHCPFVRHLKTALSTFGREYAAKGVGIVAISSNDVKSHPDDGPELMQQDAKLNGYSFPYLYDESQAVARAFDAACTPEFYVFDAQGKLAYHGQFDDSRPGNDVPVTGQDLRAAVDAVLAGKPPSAQQKPSIGCNIKWRP